MAIQPINPSLAFTSKNITQKTTRVIPEVVSQQTETVVKQAHKGKSMIAGLGFMALGALTVFGMQSCANVVQDKPNVEAPAPTNPTTTLTPAQQSISKGLYNYGKTLNVIFKNLPADAPAADFVGAPKEISYTDTSGFKYNFTLSDKQEDANSLVYTGTMYDPNYDDYTNMTRTYYKTDDISAIQYKDSDQTTKTKEVNYSNYSLLYAGDNTSASARKIATDIPGKIAVTKPDGTGTPRYETDFTITY